MCSALLAIGRHYAGRLRPGGGEAPALLYYWRPDNYARDRAFGFGYHLNQNSQAMDRAVPGDSLWAFTRRDRDSLYVLLPSR